MQLDGPISLASTHGQPMPSGRIAMCAGPAWALLAVANQASFQSFVDFVSMAGCCHSRQYSSCYMVLVHFQSSLFLSVAKSPLGISRDPFSKRKSSLFDKTRDNEQSSVARTEKSL